MRYAQHLKTVFGNLRSTCLNLNSIEQATPNGGDAFFFLFLFFPQSFSTREKDSGLCEKLDAMEHSIFLSTSFGLANCEAAHGSRLGSRRN